MAQIDGELKNAQLEQSATDPTPASTGRIYMNIASPTAAVPKYYNGTSWKTFAPVTTDTIVSNAASGKSFTIDWSLGRRQVLQLTDHCTISFSNPVEGEEHELLVMQTNTRSLGAAIPYLYAFNMIDQEATQDIIQPQRALGIAATRVHKWLYHAGIAGAYATIPSATFAPPTAPLSAVSGMAITPDGTALSITASSTPFTSCYDIDPLSPVPMENPLGIRNTPATLAGASVGSAFHPNKKSVFFASGTTPFIQGFQTNGFGVSSGTAFTNPGTLPTGAGKCVAVSPDGTLVAIGHTTTPFMSVYPFTGNAYGTKLANPATLPVAQVNAMAFSPFGNYLAVGSQTTPFLQTYSLTRSTTGTVFGAQVTNPATLPTSGAGTAGGKSIAWRPQGDYIAFGMDATPGLYVVPFDRVTGTYGAALTIGNPPLSAINAVAWSPCGSYLVAVGAGVGLWVYDFSGLSLGLPINFDGAGPVATVNDVIMHPSGKYIILGMATATMLVYAMPTRTKNYLRLIE